MAQPSFEFGSPHFVARADRLNFGSAHFVARADRLNFGSAHFVARADRLSFGSTSAQFAVDKWLNLWSKHTNAENEFNFEYL